MSKNSKIALGVLVLIVVVGAGYFLAVSNNPGSEDATTTLESGIVASTTDSQNQPGVVDLASVLVIEKGKAGVIINFDSQDIAIFQADAKEKTTVFNALKQAVSSLNLDLQSKDYGEMGVLIEKIGEKKNGDDGKYWIYYVNNVSATTSADRMEIKEGDRVEFRFEASTF